MIQKLFSKKFGVFLGALLFSQLLLAAGFAMPTMGRELNRPNEFGQNVEALIGEDDLEGLISDDEFNSFEAAMAFEEMFEPSVVLVGAKVRIEVNKRTQRMKVFVGGRKKHEWPTTTGKTTTPTPSGTFKPYGLTAKHVSKKYGWTLHYVVKVTGGYFIHLTNATGNLGKPVSKRYGSLGCMRLSPENARTLYQLVKKYGLERTTVIIS